MKWKLRAKCRGEDTIIFFPGPHDHDTQQQALAVCQHCPVKKECLEFQSKFPEAGGVWGGTTERQRLRMHRRSRNIKNLTR